MTRFQYDAAPPAAGIKTYAWPLVPTSSRFEG